MTNDQIWSLVILGKYVPGKAIVIRIGMLGDIGITAAYESLVWGGAASTHF